LVGGFLAAGFFFAVFLAMEGEGRGAGGFAGPSRP
jgi:hypothetical protein